ncbi:hypothetical protein AGMMS49975_13940 [Clostridia bacterium]|nr:hypothetical protein AGMMS49975_13940 [Clostridia bacterium]
MIGKQGAVVVLLGLAIVTLVMSGCNSESAKAQRLIKGVLRSLGENDFARLEGLLSKKTLEIDGIDKQIQASLDFFQGKVVSYHYVGASAQTAWEFGRVLYMDAYPHLTEVKTDMGKTYDIRLYSYFVNRKDKSKEGLYDMEITCVDDGTSCELGEVSKIKIPGYESLD